MTTDQAFWQERHGNWEPDPRPETERAFPPLSAEELEALRAQCDRARDFWQPDAREGDDEASENVAFYADVLRLIEHYRPVR